VPAAVARRHDRRPVDDQAVVALAAHREEERYGRPRDGIRGAALPDVGDDHITVPAHGRVHGVRRGVVGYREQVPARPALFDGGTQTQQRNRGGHLPTIAADLSPHKRAPTSLHRSRRRADVARFSATNHTLTIVIDSTSFPSILQLTS